MAGNELPLGDSFLSNELTYPELVTLSGLVRRRLATEKKRFDPNKPDHIVKSSIDFQTQLEILEDKLERMKLAL